MQARGFRILTAPPGPALEQRKRKVAIKQKGAFAHLIDSTVVLCGLPVALAIATLFHINGLFRRRVSSIHTALLTVIVELALFFKLTTKELELTQGFKIGFVSI